MIPVVHIGMILKMDLRVSTLSIVHSLHEFVGDPSGLMSCSRSTITHALFKHLKNKYGTQ